MDRAHLPDELPADPMHRAKAWIDEATAAGLQRHANAMTLATVSAEGQPSSRIVLCKDFVPVPGYLVFYTNYKSRKSQDIAHNAKVAAQFHWDAIGRQIRLEGVVIPSPEKESDRYFESRDPGSKLGAWGSDQSAEIVSRAALIAQIRVRADELGLTLPDDGQSVGDPLQAHIARPPHWGGYRLWPTAMELWMEGADRIHERVLFRRQLERTSEHAFAATAWSATLLQP